MTKPATFLYNCLAFLLILPLHMTSAAPKIDPIKFSISTSSNQIVLNEEFEIKITAEYLTFPANTVFILQGSNSFKLKLLLPDGFVKTGGDYLDYIGTELSSNKPKVSYILRGKFTSANTESVFRLLRSHKNADSQSLFVQVAKIVFNAQTGRSEMAREEQVTDSSASIGFVPFLTMAELRSGLGDSARVVEITEGGKSGTFLYDAENLTSDDDSALVLRSGERRYVRQVNTWYNVKWFGAKGDGVNNDTEAIKAAENAVHQAGGGIVFLPEGNYLIKKTTDTSRTILHFRDNISLIGAGQGGTKIINDPTTPSNTAFPNNSTSILRIGKIDSSARNVAFKDFTLVGNSSVINAGQASASSFRGISAVFQVDNLADTVLVKTLHADNVTIRDVTILDTWNAIINGKTIVGFPSYLKSVDTAFYHNNWTIENVSINGIFNRAIEFTDTKNTTIKSCTILGAGFIHLMRGSFNIRVLNNYIRFGGDVYSNDRQGHLPSSGQQAAGILLNFAVHDIIIANNIIEADKAINPAMEVAAPLLIRYEPSVTDNIPAIRDIFSSGNIYRNKKTTQNLAVAIRTSTGSYLKANNINFTNDILEGVVRLRGPGIDTAITLRNWRFLNVKVDSIITIPKSVARSSGGFYFIDSEIKKSFSISSTNFSLVNTSVNGTITVASQADSTTFNNVRYNAISIGAVSKNTMIWNMPYLLNNATNANLTIAYANQMVTLPNITATRTITLPTSPIYRGQTVIVVNGNTAAFTWAFTAATVYLPNGNALTNIVNNTAYHLISRGNGTWAAVSVINGIMPVSVGGTGATSLTGIAKGNGIGAFTAAVAGTDYVAPSGLANYTFISPSTTPPTPTGTGTKGETRFASDGYRYECIATNTWIRTAMQTTW